MPIVTQNTQFVFLQGMAYNVRFTFSVVDTTWAAYD